MAGYTNSPLVAYTRLSPNHSGQRTHSIDRISPHCVVGQCTAEGLGGWFAASSTQASSNYGIDRDGRVGMYVEEKNRSWCTSSNANDQRAITIECASDTTHPYAMRNAVYQTLIKLCVDICKRYGKKKLLWFADKTKSLNYTPASDEMVITVHRWFANKSCPGDWLYSRLGDLAAKVTAQLGGSGGSSGKTETPAATVNKNFPAVPFLVTVLIDDLNIRKSASMGDNLTGKYTGKGVFTITQVKDGWGKLKSGAGWIYLENGSYVSIGKSVSPQPEESKAEEKEKVTGTQATAFKGLSEAEAVKKIGPLAAADQKKSGILASITAAQFILESGYGKSELAQNANNCFGMKKSLSGNTWSGSAWDGKSVYTKQTKEQNADGSYVTITADFRKYPSVEDSIADHSAYLLGAMNGKTQRYAGLKGCTDYKKAAQLIKDGGYATSLTYVQNLISIIERWNLTQYDATTGDEKQEPKQEEQATATPTAELTTWYRVRLSWDNPGSQKGAFKVFQNAVDCVERNPGYSAFDENGNIVYPISKASVPYTVRVKIDDLNIRKGPGVDCERTGQYTKKGVFTIVEEKRGPVDKDGTVGLWGRLKSGAGWICLAFSAYTEKA